MKTVKLEKWEAKLQQGFSMIEILITLVLVAITMLGTAGLQVYAMKQNQGSLYRTQAILLVTDMAERIEANKSAATLGLYALDPGQVVSPPATSSPATDCDNVACTSDQLAVFDQAKWVNQISQTFPADSGWQIVCPPANAVTNLTTCSITVSWVDRRTSNSDYNVAGTNETFAYTLTRDYWVIKT